MHRLEDDRSRLLAARRLLQGVGVVPRHVVEALRQGLERLVLLGLASGVEGGQRAAVKGAVRADDDVTAGARPEPRQLEGTLVRLCARVAEEHAAPQRPAVADEAVERGGHLGSDRGAVQVGHVEQRAGLVAESVGDSGMGMPE